MSFPPHAGYVLDASVVAKWFTRHEEPDRGAALGLRRGYLEARFRLVVPNLCLIEVANALRFSPRAREEDVADALEALQALRLDVRSADWPLLSRANAISWKHRTSLYDAIYIALAELVRFPLLTADDQLARSLQGHPLVARLASLDFSTGPPPEA